MTGEKARRERSEIFLNEKGQTVAMDDQGSWRVYTLATHTWGPFAKAPVIKVEDIAPAGAAPQSPIQDVLAQPYVAVTIQPAPVEQTQPAPPAQLLPTSHQPAAATAQPHHEEEEVAPAHQEEKKMKTWQLTTLAVIGTCIMGLAFYGGHSLFNKTQSYGAGVATIDTPTLKALATDVAIEVEKRIKVSNEKLDAIKSEVDNTLKTADFNKRFTASQIAPLVSATPVADASAAKANEEPAKVESALKTDGPIDPLASWATDSPLARQTIIMKLCDSKAKWSDDVDAAMFQKAIALSKYNVERARELITSCNILEVLADAREFATAPTSLCEKRGGELIGGVCKPSSEVAPTKVSNATPTTNLCEKRGGVLTEGICKLR